MRVARREFLKVLGGASLASLLPAAAFALPGESRRAPFRRLYSSDTTNILTCVSPWHAEGAPLAAPMFDAVVDEAAAAGADAFLLQPGLGWVPWWPSRVLPLSEHVAWFRQHFHFPKADNPYLRFVLNGGDFVKQTVDRCHAKGMAAFISYRLNDAHGKDKAATPSPGHIDSLPRFYADHPEYLLGAQPAETQAAWAKDLQNWAIPAVRDFKFALIQELCRNYDLDGLELDFERAPYYFRLRETDAAQRRQIMTEFVARVRRCLDETARRRGGRRRWLSVRVPALRVLHDPMGIDCAAMAAAGADMFDLSTYAHTEQRNDLAEIRRQVPGAAVYQEMTQIASFNNRPTGRSQRRMTPEMYATTAHLAYAGGADGVALFNFQYYRDYRDAGQPADPPYTEPPFQIVRPQGDPARVAEFPQFYFIGLPYNSDPRRPYIFPKEPKLGEPFTVTLGMAPPVGGWRRCGRLRIQAEHPFGPGEWEAHLNGTPLTWTPDVAEPYPSVYRQLTGTPEEHRAWHVPAALAREGENRIDITLKHGATANLVWLDLSMPD
ncbi:MAG: hypothetical protein PW734_00780 [Verrucomicrobium sp.]|nr:hypothetical protein [Verrucomicrobium sp.]